MKSIHKSIFLLITIWLWLYLPVNSQQVGTPFVRNFERSDYRAGFQTWSIEQGDNGMMYFGNNNGLLEYDGIDWTVYPLPNNSIVRAICKGKHDVLYTGGFNEIGYFELGEMGGATFVSLLSLVPEKDRDFGEIWKIFVHPDGVIFQSFYQIMIYKDNEIKVIPAPHSFHFSFLVNGEYYVNDMKKGLLRYSMGELFPLVGMEKLTGTEIWAVLPFEKKLMIATASRGIFLYDGNSLTEWDTEANRILKEQQIYSAIQLSPEEVTGEMAFGTIQSGLLICDLNGKPIQELSWEDGLQNNTILCMARDSYSNLWLGTDHGIDYIEMNSPLTRLSYNYGLSTGYTAIIHDGNLYLGTNQGLFYMDWNQLQNGLVHSKPFQLVEQTQGQVWTLENVDGTLFCGHNSGTFIVEGGKAIQMSDAAGGWTYVQPPGASNKVIGGTYEGLVLFEKKNGSWLYAGRIAGFSESSRSLAFDTDGSLWMAHGMKGLFHLWISPRYDSVMKIEFYNSENSPLNSYAVNLASTSEGIVFISGDSSYQFNKTTKKFSLFTPLSQYVPGVAITYLKEDQKGNFWYFGENRSGVLRKQEDGAFNNIDLPFRRLEHTFVNGFEFVYPYNEESVFFGTEKGFVHYNPSFKKNYNYSFRTYVRKMQTYNPDSLIPAMGYGEQEDIRLPFSNNGIDFSFCANDFENSSSMLFSTKLEGFDQKWSEWHPRHSREFTNLYEGKYVFKVKAKNIYGTISEPVEVGFTILPPWQRTLLAYVLYVLIGLLLLVIGIKWLLIRFEKTKKRSAEQQKELFRKKEEALQREALEAEKQVIKLRNDKLRETMVKKDMELANATMNTLHKNETMISIKKELNKISKNLDSHQSYPIQHLIRKINKEIDNENQWKVFETHFENVHEAFLTRIKTAYPELTPRELKLCAYLRMNISSKEIAVLMNISTRGVEISRYRLRKKFDLSRDENLTDFILSF